MGITGFYPLVKRECPEQLIEYHLSELSGFRVAVDISIFLYKYVRSAGKVQWMNILLLLLCSLKKYGIKSVCVFDGPDAPEEKKNEKAHRKETSEKQKARLKECIRIRNILQDKYIFSDKELPEYLIKECKLLICPRKGVPDMTNYANSADIAESLNRTIDRLKKQTLPIEEDHADLAKKLICLMGLSVYQAKGEAETLCAYLAMKGQVDAVLTEDTDVLAYECPLMLAFKDHKLGESKVYGIHRKSLCEALGLTSGELTDLCIMMRCDYNRHNKEGKKESVLGFPPGAKNPQKIGPSKAFEMVKAYGRLEQIEKYLINPEPLKYRRCREIFSAQEIPKNTPCVPLNEPLDVKGLEKMIKKYRLTVGLDYIKKHWKQPEVVWT